MCTFSAPNSETTSYQCTEPVDSLTGIDQPSTISRLPPSISLTIDRPHGNRLTADTSSLEVYAYPYNCHFPTQGGTAITHTSFGRLDLADGASQCEDGYQQRSGAVSDNEDVMYSNESGKWHDPWLPRGGSEATYPSRSCELSKQNCVESIPLPKENNYEQQLCVVTPNPIYQSHRQNRRSDDIVTSQEQVANETCVDDAFSFLAEYSTPEDVVRRSPSIRPTSLLRKTEC